MSGKDVRDKQQRTVVVNLRDAEYDVYIGRKGKGQDGYFGNPFDMRNFSRELCLKKYEEYFLRRIRTDPHFKQKILALRGKRLGCFCKPNKCHGDIIVAWLESQEEIAEERARLEAARPSAESVKKAKEFHLKALAMKMTPEPIVTPMQTEEQRDKLHSMEKSREHMKALGRIGGNTYD